MSFNQLDTTLFSIINHDLHIDALDHMMVFITEKPELFLVSLIIAIMYRDKKNAIPMFLLALISMALADWIGQALKEYIQRPRPFYVIETANVLVGRGRSYSMPSNHAANAFAIATAVCLMTRDRLRYAMPALAALVAYSRPYVGVHYPSDVFAGALLGAGVAAGVWRYYRWLTARAKEAPYTTGLIVFLTVITLIRLYYIHQGPLDLSPDETMYWEYSRRPALSYYAKGPLIAWLISFGTSIFGNTAFGVRIMAVMLSVLSSAVMFRLGSTLYGEKIGVFSAVLLQFVPIFSMQALLMTIDAPYQFFWILSLYLFIKALNAGGTRALAGWWIALGVVVGLGLLTKYTMAFFLISAFLFILFERERRQLLLSPWPYIGLALCLAIFSPVIVWNASNGWVSLKHTAGHANLSGGFVFKPGMLLHFLGSQLGVITPPLLIMMLLALFRLRKSPRSRLLVWFSAPMLVFFLFKSLQGKVQANWPMTGYISCLIAFCAYYLKDYGSTKGVMKHLTSAAVILSVVATIFLYSIPVLGLPLKLDPSRKLRGWEQLGDHVSKIRASLGDESFVFSDRYQISAEMAFYIEGNPVTYCINLGRRMNQYDIWPGPEKFKGKSGILVMKNNERLPGAVARAFDNCEKNVVSITEKTLVLSDFTVVTCRGFKGVIEQEKPEKF